jgi:hypothetical protein
MNWFSGFLWKLRKIAGKVGIIRVSYLYLSTTRRNLAHLAPNPALDFLETHLVDHCNLNCKGCAHFSPLAPPWFAGIEQFENDMRQLSKIFKKKIKVLQLMGGEPLLHPQVSEFLKITRNYLPFSEIDLVTNGLILDKMNERFWDDCRSCNITISMSFYPPMEEKRKSITCLLEKEKVKWYFTERLTFQAFHNFNGDTNSAKAFKFCRCFCNVLKEGKLYICRVPAYAHYLNNKFGTSIPTNSYIDIYSPDCSSNSIVKSLNRPIPACNYCITRRVEFLWARSNFLKDEWDSTTVV